MSMTHKEMIEVIAAHKDGRIIQYRRNGTEEHWQDTEPPCWAFNAYSYRAKPLAPPAKVKMWQWLWASNATNPRVNCSMGFYSDEKSALTYLAKDICGDVWIIGPAKWTEIEVDAHCAERK